MSETKMQKVRLLRPQRLTLPSDSVETQSSSNVVLLPAAPLGAHGKAASRSREIKPPNALTQLQAVRRVAGNGVTGGRLFEAASTRHPRWVDHLTIRELSDPPMNIKVRSFNVTTTKAGVTSSSVFDMHWTLKQDTLDLLPYSESNDGRLLIHTCEMLRPATAARRLRGYESFFDNEHGEPQGPHIGVPAGYLASVPHGEDPVAKGAATVLSSKVGLAPENPNIPLEPLGGAYFPSAGSLAEECTPRAVCVPMPKPRDLVRAHYGSDFEGTIVRRAMPLEEILAGYMDGTIQDTRLALLAMRLARKKDVQIAIDLPLTRETAGRKLSDDDRAKLAEKITSAQGIRDVVCHSEKYGSMTIEPLATQPKFLKPKKLEVMNENARGQALDRYFADVVFRKGLDSVDVGAYFFDEGKLYMPVKLGGRPAIESRKYVEHAIATDDHPIQIEGIAGTAEGDLTLEGLKKVVVGEIHEEVKLTEIGEPLFLGASYPSPGTSPERAHAFLVEVDPLKAADGHTTAEEAFATFYVRVDDILQLADEGYIRDPRLELNAHILKAAFTE